MDDHDRAPATVSCLLLTGTAGAGKSVIAKETGEVLRLRSTGFAVIDLDAIAKCTSDPPVAGRFETDLMVANLAAIWPNYQRYGVNRLVLARAVVGHDELDQLRSAIPGSHWTVCRLVAPPHVIVERLRAREPGIARAFLVDLAPTLEAEMAASAIETFTVDNDGVLGVTELAETILARWTCEWAAPLDRAAPGQVP